MRVIAAALLLSLALAAPSLAETTQASPKASEAHALTIQLSQIVIDVPAGAEVGQTSLWACWTKFPLLWRQGPSFTPEDLEAPLRQEMAHVGVRIEKGGAITAGGADEGPDLRITAQVTRLYADLCAPRIGDASRWKGSIDMVVEWEVFSRRAGKYVLRGTTHGSGGSAQATSDSFDRMVSEAFARNVRELVRSDVFVAMTDSTRTEAETETRGPPDLTRPADQPVIRLIGPKPIHNVLVGDAAGSVVVIFTSKGMGSAVLVSTDGYFLTDAHVVGTEKAVKVRWPDGIERQGEVVRVHKGRDVALIKADTRGRPPLALRLTPIQIGETVFAIGAPTDKAFEGTVTRGIVSAHRTFSGLAFIQSDVAVTHGNSGGPLVDEHGAVIALTDIGWQPDGVPIGINLFTPVGDALDFLNATSQ